MDNNSSIYCFNFCTLFQRAVNAFFQEQGGPGKSSGDPDKSSGVSVNVMDLTGSGPASDNTDAGKVSQSRYMI